MNSKPVVFLDTSIQIERFIGSKERQAQIRQALQNTDVQFVTSFYVFMEFQRSLLADFVYIYNQMRRCSDWESVAYRLRSGTRSYRPRSMGNCLQIFTSALVESSLNYEKALDFLELQVTQNLPEDFWLYVEALPDPIVCDLVKLGVRRQRNGNYEVADSCRKESAACYLPTFLTEQRSKLQSIIDYLVVHPRSIKDQARVERLLAAVIENPATVLGQSACWPLGDVIIALQIPPKASLWTVDADFQPLVEALNLQLYTPTFNHKP